MIPSLGSISVCYGIIAISLFLYAWKKVVEEKRRMEKEYQEQLAQLEAK